MTARLLLLLRRRRRGGEGLWTLLVRKWWLPWFVLVHGGVDGAAMREGRRCAVVVNPKVVAVLEMVRRRFARRCCCVSFTARWCGSQRLGCSNSCRNVAGHGGCCWLAVVSDLVLLRERWRSKLGTRGGGENGGALLQFCVEMVVVAGASPAR